MSHSKLRDHYKLRIQHFYFSVLLDKLVKIYPRINDITEQAVREAKIQRVTSREYGAVKNRFIEARATWSAGPDISPSKYKDIQKGIIGNSNGEGAGKGVTGWLSSTLWSNPDSDAGSPLSGNTAATGNQARDPDFMNGLYDGACPFPEAALELRRLLSNWLIGITKNLARTLAQQVNGLRLATYEKSVQVEDSETFSKDMNGAFRELRMRVMGAHARGTARNGVQQ